MTTIVVGLCYMTNNSTMSLGNIKAIALRSPNVFPPQIRVIEERFRVDVFRHNFILEFASKM